MRCTKACAHPRERKSVQFHVFEIDRLVADPTGRRRDIGRPFIARNILGAFRRAPLQLSYMGLVLVLFAMLWIRIATLMFALFFGSDMPPLLDLFSSLFLTVNGVVFLTVGTATGAVLAFAA